MHSVLPPSSAHRWRFCSASALMELSQPTQEETEEARNGTAAHWVGAQFLMGRTELPQFAPNGVEIDDEMLDAAGLWASDVAERIMPGHIVRIESAIRAPDIHEQCFGTPDLQIIAIRQNKLFVDDFKYGFRPVEAEWNWQMACYTSGILTEFPDITDVEWRIIQPRAYGHDPIKVWRPTMMHLGEMFQQLSEAADNALSPNPKLVPSPEACRDCAAAHCCPALQYLTLAYMDVSFSAIPMNLDAMSLARELNKLEAAFTLMQARLDGLREQAGAMIKRGSRVPGWTLEPTVGKLAWTIPDAQVIQTGQLFGVNLAKDQKAITPTQAKKLLPPDVLTAFSDRRNGSMKLMKSKGWKE